MVPKKLDCSIADIVNNEKRLKIVRKYFDMNNHKSIKFDLITKVTASDFAAPHCFIFLVGESNLWFQSSVGIEINDIAIEQTFFTTLIAETGASPIVINDTLNDDRFATNALVIDRPKIRFMAAAPLLIEGEKIGALCATDTKPKQDTKATQVERLSHMAALASGIYKMRFDLKEISEFELERKKQTIRQQLALDAAHVYTWIWDLNTNLVDFDTELRKIFKISHNDPVNAVELLNSIDERDADIVKAQLESTISGTDDFASEFRIKDSEQWLIGQGKVLEWDQDGKALKIAGVYIDITEQKKSEEKTELLLRELNHRVKNTLAMLTSIANQTLRNSKSPEDFKQAFSGRIRSIAAAHTLLSDKEWELVSLKQLLQDQVNVYIQNFDKQLDIKGDDVTLGSEESLALGMVLHELATNAVKYGALSTKDGKVIIKINLDTNKQQNFMTLNWIETGGPVVQAPKQKGFGIAMIERSLDKILGSHVSLEFPKTGVEALITMPIANQR